ncbi:MAG: DnaA regulatory inactivator Hda [Alteromonadaceae bacterium]|nr:MAG: DnaA regulatory inactivator Hda [Alteromonadaceae bacterium]
MKDDNQPVQLSLGISLKDEATFENFYAGSNEGNVQVVNELKRIATQGTVTPPAEHMVIYGRRGCGLTHLLQAFCRLAHLSGGCAQYLPMRDLRGYSAAELCQGMEHMSLVCVDAFELLAGDDEWEQALFHLYNNLRDLGHTLVIASHTAPAALPIGLADLKSRVLGSVIYSVSALDDDDKQVALITRAKARGMQLPEEVARYIITRASRDTNVLFDLLDRLDDASLQQQKKLTVPFVKDVLSF